MDEKQRKEIIIQYTVIAGISSLVCFVAAFFIYSISIGTDQASFAENIGQFVQSSLFWIILLLVILIPLIAFLIAIRLSKQMLSLQKSIDTETERMQHISIFLQALIKEDYTGDITLTGEDDSLGKSLVNLRDTLKLNKENELNKRKEEGLRNWLAEGMAHFGELLRNNVNNLEKLSFLVLKDLTKHIHAVQGGFYILDDSDENNKFFNLVAFFAYDRRKYTDQQIKWGDGLIGTCALEKKTIHMKRVPESYIRVTSGLGQSKPSSLLLEPILHEDAVYGVLEFATLESFTPNHIQLTEKVAGSIGSTLSAIKSNLNTAKLLEDSKAQAQLLASQEEEMRQNMEELKATQEEAARQAQQYISLEDNINQSLMRAEFNTEGTLLQANKLFLEKFNYQTFSAIEGKHMDDFIGDHEFKRLQIIWNDLILGKSHFKGKMKCITKTGNELWTIATIAGIKQDDESANSILWLAFDISDEQQKSKKVDVVLDAVNQTGLRLEMDIHGTLKDCNDPFIILAGIKSKDKNSVTVFDLIDDIEMDSFTKRWDSIIKGMDYSSVLKIRSKTGEEKWIYGVFKGVYDIYNQIERIIFTGSDVTASKLMEIENRNQAQNLKNLEKLLRDNDKETNRRLRETKAEIINRYKEIETTNIRNETLLENTSDAAIITSSDNRILFFNKAAENLWGQSKSRVLNQNVGILFPDELMEMDDFVSKYTGPGDKKITGIRNKVKILDVHGKEKPVVFLLSKAKINNENVYLALVQYPVD